MIAKATKPGLGRVLLGLLLAATVCGVQAATPLGAPFLVSAAAGDYRSTLARSASGAFVVAWADISPGQEPRLRVQRYSAAGQPQGAPVFATVAAGRRQYHPALSMNAAGEFVLAWVEPESSQQNRAVDIHAQRFSASGQRVGALQQVVRGVDFDRPSPAVAMGPDGRYVVAWQLMTRGLDLPGYLNSIHNMTTYTQARLYGVDGLPRTGVLTVDQGVPVMQGYARYPYKLAVGMDDAGGFAVAFESRLAASSSIQLRRYDAAGAARGARQRVSQLASFWGIEPSLLVNGDGSAVVAWTPCRMPDDVNCKAYFQRYAADGAKLGGITEVPNPGPAIAPSTALLAGGPNGAFLLSWSASDVHAHKRYGQAYRADGTAEGAPFMVDEDPLRNERQAAVGSDANGDFVFSWTSESRQVWGDYVLKARRFLR